MMIVVKFHSVAVGFFKFFHVKKHPIRILDRLFDVFKKFLSSGSIFMAKWQFHFFDNAFFIQIEIGSELYHKDFNCAIKSYLIKIVTYF